MVLQMKVVIGDCWAESAFDIPSKTVTLDAMLLHRVGNPFAIQPKS